MVGARASVEELVGVKKQGLSLKKVVCSDWNFEFPGHLLTVFVDFDSGGHSL